MGHDEFLRAFENCTFPREEWKHRAHVQMAWLYLSRNSFEVALEKIRQGIKRYNACFANHGYRETETQFFVRMIHHLMKDSHTADFEIFSRSHPELFEGAISLRKKYYSDVVWHSPLATVEFIDADLSPLPEV